MSQRNDWTVRFETNELEAEAKLRAEYHRRREAHWEGVRTAKDAEMEKSATIEEQPVTGGKQRFLRYDPGLQQMVNEATSRRDGHRSSAENYERFLLMFRVGAQGEFILDVEDVRFFFEPIPDESGTSGKDGDA